MDDWGAYDLGNLHLVIPSMIPIKLRHLQSCFSEPSAARQAANPPVKATPH
jgi:hypothetical protein